VIQKNGGFVHAVAEAWNHAHLFRCVKHLALTLSSDTSVVWHMKFVHWDFINMSSDSWSIINCRFFFFEGEGHNSPQWARASSFTRFLDHTQRHTTDGRTPLDKWSARRRDLYLTTHNTHNRQTSMRPVGFQPTVSAGEWPQTYVLDRVANGTGPEPYNAQNQWQMCDLKLRLWIQVFWMHCVPLQHHETLIQQYGVMSQETWIVSDRCFESLSFIEHNKSLPTVLSVWIFLTRQQIFS
jgi:hypothetical protein